MCRYITFGLRETWIVQFFTNRNFLHNNNLGPLQLISLKYYLIDLGLITKKNILTLIGDQIAKLFNNYEISRKLIWSILWNNLCYNSILFYSWTNINCGEYTKDKICSFIQNGKYSQRSINNAYQSLVGTFERTPIGSELKQGIVKKQGRGRIVIKEGDPDIPPEVIVYNLYMFAEKYNKYNLNIQEIEYLDGSPQKIFTITSHKVENLLKTISNTNFFDVVYEKNSYSIQLNPQLNKLDVLKYSGGFHEV